MGRSGRRQRYPLGSCGQGRQHRTSLLLRELLNDLYDDFGLFCNSSDMDEKENINGEEGSIGF